MKVAFDGTIAKTPVGFTRAYPSFVNYLLRRNLYKSPEQKEHELLTATGEFGVDMELAFERSLRKLGMNKVCFRKSF
jgi:hypothetical protein